MPETHPQMSEIEDEVYGDLYDHIREIENRYEVSLRLMLATNMARSLASDGFPLEELIQDIRECYQHQLEFNERTDGATQTFH